MGLHYRMPTLFGPSLGPRQGPGGRSFEGGVGRDVALSVSFVTHRGQLASLLPPGLEPGREALVTINVLFNPAFAWLAGRGYDYVEVLFAVTHRGAETIEGDLAAVMWENLADPIILGREEAGHPKLFADISPPEYVDGGTRVRASWQGFTFLELELPGLEVGPWPDDAAEAGSTSDRPAAEGRPRFNYHYVPRPSRLDEALAAELLVFDSPRSQATVLEEWSGEGRARFNRARWEDLPTFAQVVNALAELEVVEPRPATMVRRRYPTGYGRRMRVLAEAQPTREDT